ncbi:hypothetical protein ABKN59_010596 [Abortiporus biennis]
MDKDTKLPIPRQIYLSIPIGPVIQLLHASLESALEMAYGERVILDIQKQIDLNGGLFSEYSDFFQGSDFIKAVKDNILKPNDTILMFSIDGAQLYRHKESDCWIGIWIILNLHSDHHYRKVRVIPAIVIPGPKPPKHLDSFLFPSFHHASALMNEGLMV